MGFPNPKSRFIASSDADGDVYVSSKVFSTAGSKGINEPKSNSDPVNGVKKLVWGGADVRGDDADTEGESFCRGEFTLFPTVAGESFWIANVKGLDCECCWSPCFFLSCIFSSCNRDSRSRRLSFSDSVRWFFNSSSATLSSSYGGKVR